MPLDLEFMQPVAKVLNQAVYSMYSPAKSTSTPQTFFTTSAPLLRSFPLQP